MGTRPLQTGTRLVGEATSLSGPTDAAESVYNEPVLLQFIGVSGVGNSGKSAVTELLREFESIKVFDRFFEFDILRAPDGILDLYHHLCEAWSPVRSDCAIKRFRKLVYTMGIDPRWYDIWGLARSSSQRYESVFQRQFIKESLDYVNSFVKVSYKGIWPYDLLDEPAPRRFVRKCLNRLGYEKAMHFDINVVDTFEFVDATARYLSRLYRYAFERPYRSVVLNNALEPYCASRTLDVIKNSKLIVVLRDPRDIYVSAITPARMKGRDQRLVAIENKGSSKSFLPTDDVALFVERQKIYMKNLSVNDPRILTVWFEDLILQYDENVKRIMEFVGVSSKEHTRPKQHFRPEVSKNYIFLWESYSRKQEVNIIAEELAPFLYK